VNFNIDQINLRKISTLQLSVITIYLNIFPKLELLIPDIRQQTANVLYQGEIMPVYNSKQAPFTFDNLVDQFRSVTEEFPDKRTGNNTRYTIEDIALGAFSIFFTQSPSPISHFKMRCKKRKVKVTLSHCSQ